MPTQKPAHDYSHTTLPGDRPLARRGARPSAPVNKGTRLLDGGRREHVGLATRGTRHDHGSTVRTTLLVADRPVDWRDGTRMPSRKTLDAIAERAITGGWEQVRTRGDGTRVPGRNTTCPGCMTLRSTSGACDC